MMTSGLPTPRQVIASSIRTFEAVRFGSQALALRERVLAARRVSLDELKGRGQSRRLVEARQEIAYRAWTECQHLSLDDVAKLIGRSDHSAAVHAILAGARAAGIIAAKVSQLRGHADPVDWVKLAYHAAAARGDATIESAARRAGIGRAEWRKVEQGRAISAGVMLAVCRHLRVDPLDYLASRGASAASPPAAPAGPAINGGFAAGPDARSGLPASPDASRETDGKHEVSR